MSVDLKKTKPKCECWNSPELAPFREAQVDECGRGIMELFCLYLDCANLCAQAAPYSAAASYLGLILSCAQLDAETAKKKSGVEREDWIHDRMLVLIDEVAAMSKEKLADSRRRLMERRMSEHSEQAPGHG